MNCTRLSLGPSMLLARAWPWRSFPVAGLIRRSMSGAAGGGAAPLRQPQHIPAFATYPSPPTPAHTAVAPTDQIAQGISGFQGSKVVIARRGDTFHALGGLCPHKQGELVLGDLVDVEDAAHIICPRHRKRFPGGLHISCTSGAASCPAGTPEEEVRASWRVPLYSTVVEGGWLFIAEVAQPRQGCESS